MDERLLGISEEFRNSIANSVEFSDTKKKIAALLEKSCLTDEQISVKQTAGANRMEDLKVLAQQTVTETARLRKQVETQEKRCKKLDAEQKQLTVRAGQLQEEISVLDDDVSDAQGRADALDAEWALVESRRADCEAKRQRGQLYAEATGIRWAPSAADETTRLSFETDAAVRGVVVSPPDGAGASSLHPFDIDATDHSSAAVADQLWQLVAAARRVHGD